MRRNWISGLVVLLVTTPATAGETGFFAGLNGGAAFRSGSSGTTDGGAPWAGGGTVSDVRFQTAFLVGAHAGYRFSPNLSAFVSYENISGGVAWQARFPTTTIVSRFNALATSQVVLANATFSHGLSDATKIDLTGGLGLATNNLTSIRETAPGFEAFVEEGNQTSLAARAGIGLEHRIGRSVTFGANAALTYQGGFTTGGTRSAPAFNVTEAIRPYRLDDTWGVTVGAFTRVSF